MRRILLLFAFAFSALAADEAARLDSFIARYHQLGLFNGSALVADHGVPVLKKGYGLANMEWNIPNAADTKFRLGSITKQFTAALVLQMVEQGKLDLSAPIARYLPDYPRATGDRITIHQLLNHTSGIPGYTELPQFGSIMRDPKRPQEFMKIFSGLELLFEPGTKFSYNNSAFFVLGAILEKLTGQTYEQLLRERIFDPAGMKNSGYDSTHPLLSKRAAGYDATLEGYRNTTYIDMTQPFSAGSLYSTVEDLYLWDQALYGDRILKPAGKEKMFTPGLSSYGYGVYIRKAAVTTIEHGGGINGFNTHFIRFPGERLAVAVFSNVNGPAADTLAMSLARLYFGEDVKGREKFTGITLSEAELEAFAGTYELAPTFSIKVKREGAQLIAQATNQPAFSVTPYAANKFFVKVVDAQLEFTRNAEGKVESLILHQGGRSMPGKRVGD